MPADVYECVPLTAVDVLPSPKFQLLIEEPLLVLVNVTGVLIQAVAGPVKAAVMVPTKIKAGYTTLSEHPWPSVSVSVTLYVPGML